MAPFRADISLHEAEAIHRKKQFVRAGILEKQKVAATVANADMLQAAVESDAVVDMHHVIARL